MTRGHHMARYHRVSLSPFGLKAAVSILADGSSESLRELMIMSLKTKEGEFPGRT